MSNMDWPLFCIKQTQLHSYRHAKHGSFRSTLCDSQVTPTKLSLCPCCTQTTLRFCDINSLGFHKLLWILFLAPLLFIAFTLPGSSFQSYSHYFIHQGLPSLSWFQIPKLPLCLPASSFLPSPSTPCGLISIWGLIIRQNHREEKVWWAEGVGEDSSSHAEDVGVPRVGSQAISNGAAFLPHKRSEEGIRNLLALPWVWEVHSQLLTTPLLGYSVFLGTGTPHSWGCAALPQNRVSPVLL